MSMPITFGCCRLTALTTCAKRSLGQGHRPYLARAASSITTKATFFEVGWIPRMRKYESPSRRLTLATGKLRPTRPVNSSNTRFRRSQRQSDLAFSISGLGWSFCIRHSSLFLRLKVDSHSPGLFIEGLTFDAECPGGSRFVSPRLLQHPLDVFTLNILESCAAVGGNSWAGYGALGAGFAFDVPHSDFPGSAKDGESFDEVFKF